MSGYFVKSALSRLDYTFDWGFQFLDAGETIETDLGWSVTPDGPSGVAVDQTAATESTTTAFLNGGVVGTSYLVCSRIRTTNAREVRRSLVLRISEE